jgi:amino acid transporter
LLLLSLLSLFYFLSWVLGILTLVNWSPFVPFGFSGIMAGAAIIFFAFIGFDAVSTAAEDVKNPQRDLPIGIIASLIISTVLYILVTGVLTGMVQYSRLDTPAQILNRYASGGGEMGFSCHFCWSHRRSHKCTFSYSVRTKPNFLCDVKGWSVTYTFLKNSSSIWDPL